MALFELRSVLAVAVVALTSGAFVVAQAPPGVALGASASSSAECRCNDSAEPRDTAVSPDVAGVRSATRC